MSKPESPAAAPAKANRPFVMVAIVALVVIAAISGAAILIYDSQPTQYACISIAYHGSTLDLTTPGLIHVDGAQYYISCSDGTDDGNLPSSTLNTSCLTISPKEIVPSYPGAASTYYYYIEAGGHSVTLQGASTNSTVLLQPNNAYLQVDCS